MTAKDHLPPVNEKLLVRQVASDFLREEAPAHLAELERDFDALYSRVEERLRELRSEDVHGDWRLPFDASFDAGMFVGTIVGVAAFLVREALSISDERRRKRQLEKKGRQLWKQTGSPELVVALIALVLDLVSRMPANLVEAPDLELQVHLTAVPGGAALVYVLHSVTAGFHFQTIRGPELKVSLDSFAESLLEQIEKLHEGYDTRGDRLLLADAEKELASLGQYLYRELFPNEMRQAYRRFRKVVRTIQITSDEPSIPWELIKPYDDEGEQIIDDDFFCIQFELTRWRNGKTPVSAFGLRKLACFGSPGLPNAERERELVTGLVTRHLGVEAASPHAARYQDVESLLKKGGWDLLHFVGHGDFIPGKPNEASILLEDRALFAYNLSGPIQTRLKSDRPLVFLNACRVARQGWSLTSLGGWVEAWVRRCECGAFLGPQWIVKDSLAYEFAQVFYQELEQGRPLGEAARAARIEIKEKDPGRPTWLAFAIYGHPNARVSFGTETAEQLRVLVPAAEASPAPHKTPETSEERTMVNILPFSRAGEKPEPKAE